MANVLYNAKQSKDIPEPWRESFALAQKEFDAARRELQALATSPRPMREAQFEAWWESSPVFRNQYLAANAGWNAALASPPKYNPDSEYYNFYIICPKCGNEGRLDMFAYYKDKPARPEKDAVVRPRKCGHTDEPGDFAPECGSHSSTWVKRFVRALAEPAKGAKP